MLDKKAGVSVMSLAIEMKDAIVALSGSPIDTWHGRTPRMLEIAARRAGISFRAAKALYRQEGHDPRGTTVDKVRAALNRQFSNEATRDRYEILFDKVAKLEAAIAAFEERDRVGISEGG